MNGGVYRVKVKYVDTYFGIVECLNKDCSCVFISDGKENDRSTFDFTRDFKVNKMCFNLEKAEFSNLCLSILSFLETARYRIKVWLPISITLCTCYEHVLEQVQQIKMYT